MNQEGYPNPPPHSGPPPGDPRPPRAQSDRAFGGPGDRRVLVTPRGTGVFGMWLFLAALTMLFAASLLCFIIIHVTSASAPPLHSTPLPWPLWISTAIILISSYTMHRAVQNVRQERQTRFRNAMTVTVMLAGAFLLVQTPSLIWLIEQQLAHMASFHQKMSAYTTAFNTGAKHPVAPIMPMQGFVFALILIHALHVLGGVIPLGIVTGKAHRGRYDHESCGPVRYMAMYWHFLDGVWIVMFLTLLIVA